MRGPSLEERIAKLEERLDTIPDAIAPAGGQVVDGDGGITYEFDGHVSARGLDLLAGTGPSSLPDDHKIRWLVADGSVVREDHAAVYLPEGLHSRTITTDPTSPADYRAMLEQAVDHFIGCSLVIASTVYEDDEGSVRVIDSRGRSTFPQIAGVTRRMQLIPLQVGGTGILVVGGVVTHTVNHNLGHNNYFVVGGIRGNPVNNPSACAWSYHQPNADQVQIQLQNVGGAAINVDNFWGLIVTLQ